MEVSRMLETLWMASNTGDGKYLVRINRCGLLSSSHRPLDGKPDSLYCHWTVLSYSGYISGYKSSRGVWKTRAGACISMECRCPPSYEFFFSLKIGTDCSLI
jgi:hypothetical protein